jgi:crotonobetainyl-CoA:carnitine CoA-transferase CaiB-like acyl-CoA transferase
VLTTQRINPSLIYCQAQGWATDTPEQHRPAYDDIIQTATGVADLMNRATGQMTLYPSVIADKICGQTICTAVLAALFHSARTGQGQHVEVPMYDTMLNFQLVEHLAGATTEPPMTSAGYGRLTTPHRGPRQAIDGAITVMPYTNHQWHALFCAVGDDAAIRDPRFATPESRVEHADALYQRLASIIATRTIAEIIEMCEPLGIAAQQLRTLDQTIDDALVTGQLRVAEHPLHGSYRMRQPAARFSKTPQQIRRHAPTIGEHTSEVRSLADHWNEVHQG